MKRATILVAAVTFLSVCSLAQDRSLISGDSEDKQDTPVPGVKITLRNESLRVDRTTTTNSDGLYFFAEVVPAEGYVMTASAPGMDFAPQSVKFDVEVGETRHVLPSFVGDKAAVPVSSLQRRGQSDLPYQAYIYGGPADPLGMSSGDGEASSPEQDKSSAQTSPSSAASPSQQPSQSGKATKPPSSSPQGAVESSRVPLDTMSTAISTVITGNQFRNLPLFNRNFLAVGLLVSSTHDVPAWSELKDTTFSISGQRPTSNAFLLDGMDNVASSSNQAIPFQVNDAIQEFRVTTANSDAQFGRNIGGVVNIVTRRGTAKFHGSVFGFFASDSIDASSPLSVYNGSGFDQAAAFAGPVNAPPAPNTNPKYPPIYQPNSYNQYVNTVQALNATYGTTYCTSPSGTYGTSNCNQPFDPASVLAQHDSHTQPFSSQQFGAQAGGSFLKRWVLVR